MYLRTRFSALRLYCHQLRFNHHCCKRDIIFPQMILNTLQTMLIAYLNKNITFVALSIGSKRLFEAGESKLI